MKSTLIIFLCLLLLGNYVFVFSLGLKKDAVYNKYIKDEFKAVGNCLVKLNDMIFDLNPINQTYEINSNDGRVISFNLCDRVNTVCPKYYGSVVQKSNCFVFSNSLEKEWHYLKNENILNLIIKPTETCVRGGLININIELKCDRYVEFEIENSNIDPDSCNNTIKIISRYACGNEFISFENKIDIDSEFIILILFSLGVTFLIFGNYFEDKVTVIIISIIIGLIINEKMFLSYIDLNISLILGFIISIPFLYLKKYSILTLNILIGYVIGNLIFKILIYIFDIDKFISIYYVITIISILSMIVLYSVFENYFYDIINSIIGSYFTIRGTSLILGKFPDENLIYRFISYREIGQIIQLFSLSVLYYSLAILSLVTVSLYLSYQKKIILNKKDREDINNIKLLIRKEKNYFNERFTF